MSSFFNARSCVSTEQEQILDAEEIAKKKRKKYKISLIISSISLICFILPLIAIAISIATEKELSEPFEVIFGLILISSMLSNFVALIFIILSWFKDDYNDWKNILICGFNFTYLIVTILFIIDSDII